MSTFSASEVGRLQTLLLESVLFGRPLPGGTQVRLPDLDFIKQPHAIYLLSDNFHGTLPEAGSLPVVSISPADLQRQAIARGDTGYLTFRTPHVGPDFVELVLEGRIVRAESQQVAGLSGVRVTFTKVGNDWQAAEPVYFAF